MCTDNTFNFFRLLFMPAFSSQNANSELLLIYIFIYSKPQIYVFYSPKQINLWDKTSSTFCNVDSDMILFNHAGWPWPPWKDANGWRHRRAAIWWSQLIKSVYVFSWVSTSVEVFKVSSQWSYFSRRERLWDYGNFFWYEYVSVGVSRFMCDQFHNDRDVQRKPP